MPVTLPALLAVAAGWAIARYPLAYILAPLGLGAATIIALWNRGVLAGILVLLIINGLPFVDIQPEGQRSNGGISDAVFLALAMLLPVCAFANRRSKAHDRLVALAVTWAGLYLVWWSFKVFAGSPGVPLVPAIKYGRFFLYFMIFCP